MWIKCKKRVKCYRITNKDGDTYESNIGWYYYRRWKDQLEKVEEFYKKEWYEVWVGKRKFQKKPHHKKKILTEKEAAKRDWRKEKQFKRDKARPTWGANCSKRFHKRYAWKRHRMYSKQNLKRENYEILHLKDYKHFVNPWDWD